MNDLESGLEDPAATETSPRRESLRTPRTRPAQLCEAQWELIELCVRVAQILGVPRSVGEIFGYIFSAQSPLTFENVVTGLGISSGSASHGLRYLRRLGAIKVSFYARDRRDYFQVETSLQKLVSGYLTETVCYHLGGISERLRGLQTYVTESEDPETKALSERVGLLLRWNEQADSAMTTAVASLH